MSEQGQRQQRWQECVLPDPPIVERGFLGEQLRREIARLLDSEELQWLSGDQSTHAARGPMFQLATPDEHDRLPMRMAAELLLAAVVRRTESVWAFDNPSTITPQVYPIRTIGRRIDPPLHFPHRQGQQMISRRVSPRGTALYFVEARGTVGGEIVGVRQRGDDTLDDTFEFEPESDLLLLLDSHQLYRIAPLIAGTSTVVVVNLYDSRDLSMSRMIN